MAGEISSVDETVTANTKDRHPQAGQQRRRRALNNRTRTGCERCRARRRKCYDAGNEEKPRCGRCVDADAECQYTTRLSFLDKNARTIAHGDVFATESKGSGYRSVQFVVDEASTERPEQAVPPFNPSNQDILQFEEQVVVPKDIGSEMAVVAETSRHDTLTHLPQNRDVDTSRTTTNLAPDQETYDMSSKHLRGVPIIVHENFHETLATSDPNRAGSLISLRELLVHDSMLVTRAPQSSIKSRPSIPLDLSATKSIMTDSEIGLLKEYARCVAPWLDIYDLRQTFALIVPPLAMVSPLVLDAVLKLSAASSGSSLDGAEENSNGFSDLQAASARPGEAPDFTLLQFLVRFVLLKARLFVALVPDTWEHIFVAGGPVPVFPSYDFENAGYQRVWFGTIALMSRLEIAYSLVNEVAPAIGSDILRDTLASLRTMVDEADGFNKTLSASLSCLAILADIMSLCLQPADQDVVPSQTQAQPHLSRANRWKELLNELQTWHVDRPLELHELVELEAKDTSFPTILFTNRAGVSANITYHTAMFLLMKHRPRKILHLGEPQPKEATETHVSPLWHARRVCGIALSSDPEHTQRWDPCMIAAFTLAARQMSHPAQQKELLSCLHRVKASGWRVDGLLRSLRDEWGLSGPG